MEPLFENKVKLRESDHKYFDKEGNEYVAFSRLLEEIAPAFNENLAHFVGKAKGVHGDYVKAEWDKARDEGTRIDKAIKEYAINKKCEPELEEGVKKILKMYGSRRLVPNLVVYSEDRKTAGEADMVFLTNNKKDSHFGVGDFKCYEKMDGNLYENKGWLGYPFDYLPNSKFIKIGLQLSYYAYHIEKLTGRKCKELFIHLIKPSTISGELEQKWIYVPYMKNDIEVFLEFSKDKIQELIKKDEFVI